jgi:hypothetical protein
MLKLYGLILLGLIILIIVTKIKGDISSKCVSKSVNIGLNIMLTMSIILIILPISNFVCRNNCDCQGNEFKYESFLIIIFVVFLILGVSSSFVWDGLNNNSDCDVKNAKTGIGFLTIISFLSLIVIGYLGQQYRSEGSMKGLYNTQSSEESQSSEDIYNLNSDL